VNTPGTYNISFQVTSIYTGATSQTVEWSVAIDNVPIPSGEFHELLSANVINQVSGQYVVGVTGGALISLRNTSTTDQQLPPLDPDERVAYLTIMRIGI